MTRNVQSIQEIEPMIKLAEVLITSDTEASAYESDNRSTGR